LAQAAKYANPHLLVSPRQVKENISKANWVVVDCRPLKDYAKGHIPGAISLGKRCDKALRDSTARMFRNPRKYEKIFGKVGIGNDTHVVLYHGDVKTITRAAVAFWIMEVMGHDKVHLLNGGLEAWQKAGYKLDSTPTMKSAKTFKAKPVWSRYSGTDEIGEIAKGQKKNVTLIDSRTKKEFEGKDIRALRGGHVPNVTLNVSHVDTLVQKKGKGGEMVPTGYLDPNILDAKFGKLDKNRRTVAYCQTGTRSTLTYLELRLMGFKDPANWDESWRVYGSHYLDLPVEGEQWFDFNKVRKLEKKVKKLEKALSSKK
jgi:thiosulfate/3-mercaptopyruvate sulfurtransferase